MSRIKLTMHAIAKLAAPTASGKPVVHWDTDLKGFAVICSGISNSKAYIVQRDLSGGRSRRVTIAKTNEMTLTNAKVRAAKILVEMRDGKDPKAKHAGTLQERGKFCNQDYSTAVRTGLLAAMTISVATRAASARMNGTRCCPSAILLRGKSWRRFISQCCNSRQ